MDTQTTDAVEHRTRTLPTLLKLGLVVVFAVALTAALFVGLRLARPGVLPGVVVAGVEVGGLDRQQLEQRLEALEAQLAGERISLVRTAPAALGPVTVSRSAAEYGYQLDVDATRDRVLARGRQRSLVTAVADHLHAFRGRTVVEPVEGVDDAELDAAVAQAEDALEVLPVDGAVTIADGGVVRIDPAPGAEVDTDALATQVRTAVLSAGDAEIDVPVQVVAPELSPADVQAAYDAATTVLSAPVALTRGEVTIPLGPQEHLSDIFSVQRSGIDRDGQRLEVLADPAAVAVAVPDTTEEAVAADPVDAQVMLVDGAITVTPSTDGFAFDAVAVAAQLEELALEPDAAARTAELAGEVTSPQRTTADAEALGITEKVSEFTTYHACCQGRVTNIQQMARTVDGAIIEPGETFSLNGFVGERTRAKGYVGGGAILNGEYIEDVGGGVSQFTTTMYNAAFFGGYAIPEHKAHSYYISRYPVGREATLDYPSVDLKITNNSPYGILVDTSYTPTSITVAFWGTSWVHVAEHTGPRHNFREAETQIREAPDLPAGETRVVQSAGTGFDIVVTRTLTFPDGRTEQEEIFTRYLAQPRIVERGVAQPAAPPDQPPTPAEVAAAG